MKSTKKKWMFKCAIMFAFAFPLVSLSIPMVYKPLTNHLIKAKAASGVAYMAWDSESKTVKSVSNGCESYTTVTSDLTTWSGGWYVVSSNVTISSPVDVLEEVNLILCDGVELKAQEGICAYDSANINIYAQSTGSNAGRLIATGTNFGAGIGGNEGNCGNITIHGGKINAEGYEIAPGIGSGANDGSCGNITIYGGIIDATGQNGGAGIGSGGNQSRCGNITIYGGTVYATGQDGGAGIGSGNESTCSSVTINGGSIIANGGDHAAGIGGSPMAADGYTCRKITINGGNIIANGGFFAPGIGTGYESWTDSITINGGSIEATGGNYAAGIGGGDGGKVGTITISDQVSWLNVTKGDDSPDCIGRGDDDSTCESVTLCGVSGTIEESPYIAPTITFNLDEGEEIKDENVAKIYKEGKAVALPTNVTKEGCVFLGWYDNEYLDGNSVTEITEEDEGAKEYWARWVETTIYEFVNSINALPELENLTLDNKEEVYALWDFFEDLTPEQSSQFQNLDSEALFKLSTSIYQIDTLIAESVTNDINALPAVDDITLEDKDKILAVKETYDALNQDQKEMILAEKVTKLENAVNRIAYLENGGDVIDEIEALPAVDDITLEDKDKILAAKEAYDALSPEKKANFPAETVTKLENALDRIALLENGGVIAEEIDALPAVENLTLEDKDEVFAAKEAYDALSSEQKENIPAEKVAKLLEAVEAINTMVAEDVTNAIETLPELGSFTIENKDQIEAVIAKYEALTDEQKEKLSAETIAKIAKVKKEFNDVVAANEVAKAIDSLPEVENITLDDKDDIIAAKEAYDALSSEQKAKLAPEVIKTLEEASKEIDNIVKAKEVIDAINSLPDADSIKVSDKEVIEATIAKYETLNDEQKAKVDQDTVNKLYEAKEKLGEAFVKDIANDIKSLPDAKNITLADKEEIEEVIAKYDALTDEQKEHLDSENIEKIEEVLDSFNTLVAEDTANDINELPTVENVSLADKEKIENIIEKFESLTDGQKEKLSEEVVEKYNEIVTEFETIENANKVINELKNPSEITSEDIESVQEAKETYESLTDKQKEKLPDETVQKLEEAEHAVNVIIVDEVKELVDNLGEITIDDKEAIEEARTAYEALSDEQKEMVPAEIVEKLIEAEAKLAAVEKDAADTETANAVTDMINALPDNVSESDKEAIEDARSAYDALTEEQKAKVSAEKLAKLNAAEAKLAAIEKDAADTETANDVTDMINALPDNVSKSDKEAIEDARSAYDALTEDQKAKVSAETLAKLNAAEAKLAKSNGLSSGAIAGIVVGSIFFTLIITCLVLFILNKKGIINIPFLNKKK